MYCIRFTPIRYYHKACNETVCKAPLSRDAMFVRLARFEQRHEIETIEASEKKKECVLVYLLPLYSLLKLVFVDVAAVVVLLLLLLLLHIDGC